MRVLHVITSLRTGGAEHLLVDLLPRLRERGHEVELLLFDGTHTAYYAALSQQGIAIHALSRGARAMHNPLLLFRVKAFFRQHHYDIVHTHNTPCQLLIALAAPRALLLTTEHNTTNRRRAWRWYRGVDRWMYSKYRHVICVSKGVEEALRSSKNLTAATAISTIPNGIDLSVYAAAQPLAALREQHKGKHIIIMVARFRPQKDHATLLRAMRLLPDDYVLLLVGDGECRQDCEALATALDIAGKVCFLGFRTDVPSLLATADVFVLSSHWEGCPLSVVEGMAAGLPVVASDVDGLREIVGAAGILFPHGDHAALATSIKQLCDDKALYRAVADKGQQYAMQYDIDRMTTAYEQTYKTILRL